MGVTEADALPVRPVFVDRNGEGVVLDGPRATGHSWKSRKRA